MLTAGLALSHGWCSDNTWHWW